METSKRKGWLVNLVYIEKCKMQEKKQIPDFKKYSHKSLNFKKLNEVIEFAVIKVVIYVI